MRRWAILCPGKSLATLDTSEVIYDGEQVIAVNHAILFGQILPSYWALLDGEVFKECASRTSLSKLSGLPIGLWIPDNFENSGRTADWEYSHFEAYRAFATLKWKGLDRLLAQPAYGVKINWESYSLFTAIGLAVLQGGKEIHVYGADFSGEGYFIEIPRNFRRDHRLPRWNRELEAFNRIQSLLLENRIFVIRHAREGVKA